MEFLRYINIEHLYQQIWLWSTVFFTVLCAMRLMSKDKHGIARYYGHPLPQIWPISWSVAFAYIIGTRPLRLSAWGDTSNYSRIFYNVRYGIGFSDFDTEFVVDTDSEWLWDSILNFFAHSTMDISVWYVTIAAGYIGFMYLAVKRMFPAHTWAALLFCVGSFSFLSYSYNGIRNGLACSMILLAISYYIQQNRRDFFIGLLISFLAMGIHRSTFLPSICIIICLLPKLRFGDIFTVWIFCIVLSLVIGEDVQKFFASLGFDDRLQRYGGQLASESADAQMFSHLGFRWDFLLYSAIPIAIGGYITWMRKVYNKTYSTLICTYMLANSFWVLMNMAPYSNRFAYLSWFMFPIVIAYPVLKMQIWKHQATVAASYMMINMAITVALTLVFSVT